MTDPRVGRLRSQVLEEIHTFQVNLSRLAALDFSNPAPKSLIDELLNETEGLRTHLLTACEDFENKPDRALEIISNSHRKITSRIPFLGYIERAETRHTPWSLLESIQYLAGAIIPGYRVIIASVDEHNYRVEWYPKTKRLFLWLPRLHRLNVLWHTNIGHELFHPAIEPFFQEHRPTVAPVITDACKTLLASHGVPTDDSDLFAQKRLDMVVGETLKIWERGLSEILCDFGCALIFGPAAMMALLSMAQCHELDACPTSPQYYPPWRFRFRMVHRRIGEKVQQFIGEHRDENPKLIKFFDSFSQSLDAFDKLAKAKDDIKQIKTNAFCRMAYEQIDSVLDAGWKYVDGLVCSKVGRWGEAQDQVLALVARLDEGIPPSEVAPPGSELSPQPADFSAILVAGWVYESFWQLQEPKTRKYDYSTLMRLILKGCEDAALRRGYEKPGGKSGAQ